MALFSPQTPLESWPDDVHISLKREDKSSSGSHKFRYLRAELERLNAADVKKVVLSTTGNAGITATKIGRELGIEVICLMSDRGDMNKAAQIESDGGLLIVSPRPVRLSKYIAKKYRIPLLRASQDEEAVEGYVSLGQEIIEQASNADAIVNFCTSGTSSVGIMEAYQRAGLPYPALHIVQSGKSCSVVKALHPEQVPGEAEDGVGLSDTPRKEQLLDLIQKSGGDAHYIAASDVDVESSWEGRFALQAARALEGYQHIVVILSGREWPIADTFKPQHMADALADVDAILSP